MTFWLSSYPRSGNTLLRQVLHSGWGLMSASAFPNDLGNNLALIRACGHVETHGVNEHGRVVMLNPHNLPVKTHLLPPSPTEQAIYMIRDGREACVSLWQFWEGRTALEDIVCGRAQFGSWSDHVLAWNEGAQIDALLRYEVMVERPAEMVDALAKLYGPPRGDPIAPLRNRDQLAARDGKWVRPQSDWRRHWSEQFEDLFMRHNRPAYARFYGAAQ